MSKFWENEAKKMIGRVESKDETVWTLEDKRGDGLEYVEPSPGPGKYWDCNPKNLLECIDFLKINYFFSKDGVFRVDYNEENIKWWARDDYILVLLRSSKNNAILGSIIGSPREIVYAYKNHKSALVNFLCVKKEIRSLGLARLLIEMIIYKLKEVNVWSCIFTTNLEYIPNMYNVVTWMRPITISSKAVEQKLVPEVFLNMPIIPKINCKELKSVKNSFSEGYKIFQNNSELKWLNYNSGFFSVKIINLLNDKTNDKFKVLYLIDCKGDERDIMKGVFGYASKLGVEFLQITNTWNLSEKILRKYKFYQTSKMFYHGYNMVGSKIESTNIFFI